MRVSWMLILYTLTVVSISFAQPATPAVPSATSHSDELTYAIRLFYRQVPPALELSPQQPFVSKHAPLFELSDGRKLMIRGPVNIAVDGDRLRLGNHFSTHTETLTVTSQLRLRIPGGAWADFTGELRLWVADGELQAEIRMPREDYVKAVLAGEGGGMREPEALKALAVAIRSYAFATADRHQAEGFHFCDTTHCQDLRLAARHPALNDAVEATTDELLWRQGHPVPAWHHADSGGYTEDARAVWGKDAPAWLRGAPDPWSLQPQPFTWQATLKRVDILRALAAEGYRVPQDFTLQALGHTASGRIARLAIGAQRLTASTFRFAIGRQLGWNHLRSDLYEWKDDGTTITFSGRGAGHGVGLSQRGAQSMAREGKDYRTILAQYFPGSQVGISAQGIQWTQRSTGMLRFFFAVNAVDSSFPPLVERELQRLEQLTGFHLRQPLTIRVYPDLDTYRNHSANPGWVAAGTRSTSQGQQIAFQPLARLHQTNTLTTLVRHELIHALLLQEANTELPRWFQEGMAHWLAEGGATTTAATHSSGAARQPRHFQDFRELDACLANPTVGCYQEAVFVTRQLIRTALRQYGRQSVLAWVRNGPPEHDHVLLRELQQPR